MTPELSALRACTPVRIAESRPEWLTEDDPWDPFFPENAGPGRPMGDRWKTARAICAECPPRVRVACLALGQSEPHGMWGGKTPRERGTQYMSGGPRQDASIADRAAAVARAMPGNWTVRALLRALDMSGKEHTAASRGIKRAVDAGWIVEVTIDGQRYYRRRHTSEAAA